MRASGASRWQLHDDNANKVRAIVSASVLRAMTREPAAGESGRRMSAKSRLAMVLRNAHHSTSRSRDNEIAILTHRTKVFQKNPKRRDATEWGFRFLSQRQRQLRAKMTQNLMRSERLIPVLPTHEFIDHLA